MAERSKKVVVNSWNEWDPLKHMIVGRPNGTMIQAPEPAVEREFPKDGFPLGNMDPLPQEMVEKAKEQMDNFAKISGEAGDSGGSADTARFQPDGSNSGLGAEIDVRLHAAERSVANSRERDSGSDDVLSQPVV